MVNPNNPKKWLIVTQYYPPEIGAPQIRLRSLASALKKHGYAVEILTAMPNYPVGKIFDGYKGKISMQEEIDGITVHRVWLFAGTGKSPFIRLANYLTFTFTALVRTLTIRRPDIIFVEAQPLSLGIVGLMAKWLRRVPYVYNIPDLQIDVARQVGFLGIEVLLNIATWLENLFMKQSFTVSTVTHRFIEHFVERGIDRKQISFLPNGADADFLQPMEPDQELLDRWQLHGKKVFLYVGTHAYYHGLDTLIEAARILQEQQVEDDDIVILMIGSGPERERLKQLAADYGLKNVIFGQSPYEEMARLYSLAYASVATLRNVSVAKQMRLSKIFPSMSCKVPVIYAGIGEAAELIASEGVGISCEAEQPQILAEAIRSLVNSPDQRDAMGQRGRDLIDKEYAWTAIVEKWLQELGFSPGTEETHVQA